MKARTAARLAWSLVVFGIVLATMTLALGVTRGDSGEGLIDFVADLPWFLSFLLFIPVGALIASRHPGNAVGWILLVAGLCEVVSRFSYEYAAYSLVLHPGSLPGGDALAWLSAISWAPEVTLLPVALLRFPNGRLLSRRWAPASWVPVAWLIAFFAYAIALWPYKGPSFLKPTQSFGVEQLSTFEDIVFGLYPLVLLSVAASLVCLIIRFRRSEGEERQQLKWIAYASGVALAGLVATEVVLAPLGRDSETVRLVADSVAGPGIFAIAAGVAMLKYRLYDIDLLINRTLVYGALTAVLALVYVLGVVGLGGALRELANQGTNNLAVAASTLAVAALFRPARTRLQRLIDRRFYRKKYDATQTLEAFSARLRDEIELDGLTTDLLLVVRDTMQPAHASLWLRGSEAVK